MNSVLQDICDQRLQDARAAEAMMPASEVEAQAHAQLRPRGFALALQQSIAAQRTTLITEVKKASPSAGIIREDFDPATIAQSYEAAGATCLSVLTEPHYFKGSEDYLLAARQACSLPVLRKDFMLTPYQIIVSRAIGADCVLLIMAALSDDQAQELEACAIEYGLDVLIEVHDAAELERALTLRSPLIGINNRNLKTLDVDLQTSLTLKPLVPEDRVVICESGIKRREHVLQMQEAGMYGFLVGESLMRQDNIEQATHALMGTAS